MKKDPAKRFKTMRERLQAPIYDSTGNRNSLAAGFWWKASGPILTIFMFFIVAILALTGMRDAPPASLILIPVAYSAFTGGLGIGLVSSFLSVLAFLSIITISDLPQNNFLDFQQAFVLSTVSFSISILLGLLKQHDDGKTRKLRISEQRFRSMFESIQDIYFRTDLQGWIQTISPSVKNELGYEPADVIGRQFASLSVKEADANKIFRLLNSSEEVLDYEVEFNTKDGKTVFLSVSAQKIFDNEDNPIAFEGSARNTTKRKLAEDSLIHELSYEKAISGISAAFVAPDNFDTALDSALANISQLSRASRSYLFTLSDDKKLISNTNEWVAPSVSVKKPALQNISTLGLTWALSELAKGEQIKINDVSRAPSEAQLVVAELKRDDIGSLLLAPINASTELIGFVGIDMVGQNTFVCSS
ncbi:MAG TPA: PAS domain S-box protein [Actinobacteria bacterium]|nr:PAS domain S-box protein [Actinomycetota bacterium]